MENEPLLEDYFLGPDATIRDAVQRIDRGASQTALIVDAERHLLGVVTDGDVRRAILRDITLDQPVSRIMSSQPKVMLAGTPDIEILRHLQLHALHQIPVVDSQNRVVALRTIDDFMRADRLPNTIVIMAGGLGTRLKPITNDLPKPMVGIGGRPLLETTIMSLVNQGFFRFRISVNHLGDVIEDHFGDGSKWNADIQYLREPEALGTAGSLKLLTDPPDHPLIVMNGDLLTSLNFAKMLAFHQSNNAAATMGVREHRVEIPYGVIESDGAFLTRIKEKPANDYLINAGVYVIDPWVIDVVETGGRVDMTDVCEAVLARNERVGVYRIEEYWRDIGQLTDLKIAQSEIDAISFLDPE
jgi:dTDP-glucose pyrophosphorylase